LDVTGTADKRLDFDQAYALLERGGREYETSRKVSFVAEADICKKGTHQGERIIRFISKTSGKVSATAYACCWGFRTNCSKTHIDVYTVAIHG
jgi:hypothetical protein